jgi:hypothetical protein
MKFIKTDSGEIGLLVELPIGTHVVEIAKSVAVFTAHDPMAGALINGTMKEKAAWVALVNNWRYLWIPFALLARTATANPDDPRLAIYPLMQVWKTKESSPGIVLLDITDAADLYIHDPTGRLVMAKQFAEAVAETAELDMPSTAENVHVIDFSRRSDAPV